MNLIGILIGISSVDSREKSWNSISHYSRTLFFKLTRNLILNISKKYEEKLISLLPKGQNKQKTKNKKAKANGQNKPLIQTY